LVRAGGFTDGWPGGKAGLAPGYPDGKDVVEVGQALGCARLNRLIGIRASGRNFDGIALDELSVHVDGDCDPIPGMPAVVQVVAVLQVDDIYVIVLVPVV
jgi:hypothetical protein